MWWQETFDSFIIFEQSKGQKSVTQDEYWTNAPKSNCHVSWTYLDKLGKDFTTRWEVFFSLT